MKNIIFKLNLIIKYLRIRNYKNELYKRKNIWKKEQIKIK